MEKALEKSLKQNVRLALLSGCCLLVCGSGCQSGPPTERVYTANAYSERDYFSNLNAPQKHKSNEQIIGAVSGILWFLQPLLNNDKYNRFNPEEGYIPR